MLSFEQRFNLILNEDNLAGGAGSVFGSGASDGHGGDIGNSDWYAPGDARNLFGGGVPVVQRRKKRRKKKKKR